MNKKSQSAELMEVIRVKTSVGKGTDEDPCRIISEFWSKDGHLLAVNDPRSAVPGARNAHIERCDAGTGVYRPPACKEVFGRQLCKREIE